MRPPALRSGLRLGSFELDNALGQGGNGEIWRATRICDGEVVAIKILRKLRPIALHRFQDEVDVMRRCRAVSGIMPVLEYGFPQRADPQWPWYAMPLGVSAPTFFANARVEAIVAAVLRVARAMAVLHGENIVHRDIKPANLVVVDGQATLGDFGLVDFPEKEDEAAYGDESGPRWTMAPEVRRLGARAAGKPADVYSLAKSLWILISKEERGFRGSYSPVGETGLRRFCQERMVIVGSLDALMMEATDQDPDVRPTMAQFADRLTEWQWLLRKVDETHRLEWRDPQTVIAALSARFDWVRSNSAI